MSPSAYRIDPQGRDVHGENRLLAGRGRGTRVELPGGVIAWWITDYELIKSLLTDPRVSRDTYQHWPAWGNGESELAKTWSLAMWVADRNMITAYGAEHTRLRKVVSKAFTARRTAALRPRIEEITAGLLDDLARERAGAVVDLRERFAYPLPVQVISQLLGIPDHLRGDLLRTVHAIMDTDTAPEDAKANEHELYRILGEIVKVRRDEPGDDLTSAMIQVAADSGVEGLSERELIDTVMLMFTAGHETTVNLLDQAIYALLRHPAQLAKLRNGEAAWADAIEETLRLEAPFVNLPLRYAVTDIDLGDLTIAAGEPIVIAFGAPGRDPRLHGDTVDTFDLSRPTRKEHLSFGHGVHYCVGAPLARLEAEVGLPELFARFPGMTLADPDTPPATLRSFVSNGHETLPVRLR